MLNLQQQRRLSSTSCLQSWVPDCFTVKICPLSTAPKTCKSAESGLEHKMFTPTTGCTSPSQYAAQLTQIP